MSISSEVSRNEYLGNGVATSFAITFPFFSSNDLKVIKRLTDGTQSTLDVSDYTVTGTNLILPTALPSGEKIVILRDISFTQETEFRNQGEFYPEVVEDTVDKITMQTQQLNEKVSRSLVLAESTGTFDPTFPSDLDQSPGVSVVVNALANGFIKGPTVSEIANAQTYATNAQASADAADISEANAAASALAAGVSETNAAASELAAATSETNAAAHEAAALGYKNDALASANNADTSEANALSYKNYAQTSATNAATSEANALTYKNAAQTSASNALTSANNAAQSAIDAAAARTLIVADVANNTIAGADQTASAPTTLVVNLTGALTSLIGIGATVGEQALILVNKTGGDVTVKNENASATAANRIITGTGAELTFKSDASLWLIYDLAGARWRIVGGAGGSTAKISSSLALAGSGTLSLDASSNLQTILVQGASAPVTLSNTPFTTTAPQNGTVVKLIGNSDSNTVEIPANDAAKGVLGYSITLGKGQTVTYEYNSTLDRYVILGVSN